jgi:PAS domain S-box-containing protein
MRLRRHGTRDAALDRARATRIGWLSRELMMSAVQARISELPFSTFRDLLEADAPFFVYRMSLPDGRYDYVDPKCSAVTGYGPGDFYRARLLIRRIIHPDWRRYFDRAWERLLADQAPAEYEYPIRDRSGRTRWLSQRNVLLRDAAGKLIAIEGIVSDITGEVRTHQELEAVIQARTEALQEANESLRREVAERDEALTRARGCAMQLRVMADHLPAAVSYVDAERRYRFVNATYQHWFGYATAAIVGRPLWEVLGDSAYASIAKHVDAVLSGRKVTFEAPIPHEHGGTRYVRANYVPHWDDFRRKVVGFFVLVHDISVEKAAEAAERRHLLELAHVDRIATVGETAGHMVHELSQPLTALPLSLDACRRSLAGGDLDSVAQTLGAMENQLENMSEVIRGFRRLLRREKGRKMPVDVADLIRKSVALVESQAHVRGTSIEVRIMNGLPRVMLDETMVGQVILNLLRNAVEATEAPQGRPEPIAVIVLCSGEQVEVRVEDRGTGLSPDAKTRLFEPFFTTKPDGVGMGLMIAQRIIQSHGGRLWAEDAAGGRGARFCFTVPTAP